jgi:hypothetical protein
MFGMAIAAVTFAGPASADDGAYPPPVGTKVIPASQAQAPAKAAAAGELAFTGTNALVIGSLGGLLLVGGTTLVLVGRRRKANS